MATIIHPGIVVHLPADEYEQMVIAANRRLAELNIVRIDRRPVKAGPWPNHSAQKEPQS